MGAIKHVKLSEEGAILLNRAKAKLLGEIKTTQHVSDEDTVITALKYYLEG